MTFYSLFFMNPTNPPIDDSDDLENPPLKRNDTDFESLYFRAKADLENYRKQVEKAKIDSAKFANENCLSSILPILDNFKRASEDASKFASLARRVRVERLVRGALGNMRARRIVKLSVP